jgi:hypothetical protein
MPSNTPYRAPGSSIQSLIPPTLFAANGNGLCKNFKNLYECQGVERKMPSHTVYSITYVFSSLPVQPWIYSSAPPFPLLPSTSILQYKMPDSPAKPYMPPWTPLSPPLNSHQGPRHASLISIQASTASLPPPPAFRLLGPVSVLNSFPFPENPNRSITKAFLAGESAIGTRFLGVLGGALAEIAGPSAEKEASDGQRVGWEHGI